MPFDPEAVLRQAIRQRMREGQPLPRGVDGVSPHQHRQNSQGTVNPLYRPPLGALGNAGRFIAGGAEDSGMRSLAGAVRGSVTPKRKGQKAQKLSLKEIARLEAINQQRQAEYQEFLARSPNHQQWQEGTPYSTGWGAGQGDFAIRGAAARPEDHMPRVAPRNPQPVY